MKFLRNFLVGLATILFISSSSYAIELTEILFPEGSFITIKAVNDMNVTINPSGNSYCYDLRLKVPFTTEQFRQVFKINYNTAKTRQKIFGSINGDFSYNPNETNGKNVGQGCLTAYRNGSFQTSWYNAFSTGTNKIYKVEGTTNKYLIGIYYSLRDDTFFGINENGNFTYGPGKDPNNPSAPYILSNNDPNAQFEIEIYATEQEAIASIQQELEPEPEIVEPRYSRRTTSPFGGARVRTTTQQPRRRQTQAKKEAQKKVTTRTRTTQPITQAQTQPTPEISTAPVQATQTQPTTSTAPTIQTRTQTVRPTKAYTPVISRGQRPRVYQRRSGKRLSPTNARQIGIGF